jgi:putative hydrolase of the HAD superfamily
MEITAVTFDFWNTLVHDTAVSLTEGRRRRLTGIERIIATTGYAVPPDALERAYDQCVAEMDSRFWRAHRDAPAEDQVRVLLDCVAPELHARLSAEQLAAVVESYVDPVLHLPPMLMPGADIALRALATRGLTLCIISNTGRTPGRMLRRVLERYDVLQHFRVISYSDEVGYRKPSARIFAATLEAAGARPEQTVHVGDNPIDDVWGAQQYGMRAVHYAFNGQPPAADAELVVTELARLPDALFS